jgi:hypothetical protein
MNYDEAIKDLGWHQTTEVSEGLDKALLWIEQNKK